MVIHMPRAFGNQLFLTFSSGRPGICSLVPDFNNEGTLYMYVCMYVYPHTYIDVYLYILQSWSNKYIDCFDVSL